MKATLEFNGLAEKNFKHVHDTFSNNVVQTNRMKWQNIVIYE